MCIPAALIGMGRGWDPVAKSGGEWNEEAGSLRLSGRKPGPGQDY